MFRTMLLRLSSEDLVWHHSVVIGFHCLLSSKGPIRAQYANVGLSPEAINPLLEKQVPYGNSRPMLAVMLSLASKAVTHVVETEQDVGTVILTVDSTDKRSSISTWRWDSKRRHIRSCWSGTTRPLQHTHTHKGITIYYTARLNA